jgi:hypothetical protein
MATKTKRPAGRSKAKLSAASLEKAVEQQVAPDMAKAASKVGLAAAAQQSALIDYYLLIDFGFSTSTFQPNSVQFYSNTTGFLCSKTIDDASLTSLVPILNCQQVRVTWDTATLKAVHIYGREPK